FDLDDALVVAAASGKTDVEPVARQHSVDHVAPFDERDGVVAQNLLEPEVVQLLERVDAIDVHVHDGHSTFVLANDGERGAHDRVLRAERPREAACEQGLARSEVAGQGDDVAGAEQLADRSRQREGLVRRTGHDAASACHAPDGSARSSVTRRNARFTRTKSARACASAVPPLRNTAEGWNVGIKTLDCRNGNSRPRSFVMPSLVSSSSLVAKFPRVTTTAGSMKPSWPSRSGRHASISSGSGSRLPGGRHLTTFAMYTSSRRRPMSPIRPVRRRPAR